MKKLRKYFIIIAMLWFFCIAILTTIKIINVKNTLAHERDLMVSIIDNDFSELLSTVHGVSYFVLSNYDTAYEDRLTSYIDQVVELNPGIENVSYAPAGVIEYVYNPNRISSIGNYLYDSHDAVIASNILLAQQVRKTTITSSFLQGQRKCEGFLFHQSLYDGESLIGFLNVCYTKSAIIQQFTDATSHTFTFNFYNDQGQSQYEDIPYQDDFYFEKQVNESVANFNVTLDILPSFIRTNLIQYLTFFLLITGIFAGFTYGYYYYMKKKASMMKEKEKLIYYDALIHLPNQVKLNQDFLDKKNKFKTICYGFISLDNFSVFNNLYGYDVGRELLSYVSTKMNEFISDALVLYYWANETFVFGSYGINKQVFIKEILKISNAFKTRIHIEDISYLVKLDIGIVCYPEHAKDYLDLIKYGHIAMNQRRLAEQAYTIYSDRLMIEYTKNKEISGLLKDFDLDDLEVFYQPIVQVNTGMIIGYEALLRVQIQSRYINTQKVVEYYESKGQITDIDVKVFEKVCKNMAQFTAINPNIFISTNLSTISITKKTYVQWLENLKTYKMSSDNIVVEVTETHRMDDYLDKLEILQLFKDAGFKIALDDFGTGNSSLNYLNRIPINILKIDKHFIDTIHEFKTLTLLEAVKTLGDRLEFSISAEGIEHLSQLNIVKDIGFNYYQGYYFSKPLPFDQAIDILKKQQS